MNVSWNGVSFMLSFGCLNINVDCSIRVIVQLPNTQKHKDIIL